MKIKKRTYKQIFLWDEHCPWCNKKGVRLFVFPKSIKKKCLYKCGYLTTRIPKNNIPFEERRRIYKMAHKMKKKKKKETGLIPNNLNYGGESK
jgi:hypothetical protein